MNNTLGNYLFELGGYAKSTKPMKDWNMNDYMQFMSTNRNAASPPSGQSQDSTSNLGKFIGQSMGIQTSNGLGGTMMNALASPAIKSAATNAAGGAAAGAGGGLTGLMSSL